MRDKGLEKKDVANLFLQTYQILKQEILLQITSIKTHVRYSQAVVTALISVVSFLYVNNDYSLAISDETATLWILLLLAATTVICYLLYAILEAIFAMHALGEYLSSVENRLNRVAGRKIIVWESEVVGKLYNGLFPFRNVPLPLSLMNIYVWLAVFALVVCFPLYVYFVIFTLPSSSFMGRTVVVLSALYSVFSFFLATYAFYGSYFLMRGHVRTIVDDAWAK